MSGQAGVLGERSVEQSYRDADLVISTPGGFLHEYYDIETTLRGFGIAARLGKTLVLFAQSIGPFSTAARREAVGRALAPAALIAVRDSLSVRHLADCGIAGERVVQVPDAVFLWRRFTRELYAAKSGPPKRAGFCFREWPRGDDEQRRRIIVKARRLVEHVASRGVQELVFVSTCQGVPGYVDDSELSIRIVAGLDPSLRRLCVVDRRRYHPEELIRVLAGCDIFAGMRLHACLLAMLGGTPAMGLAYESKTPEIYRQLGLKAYQVPSTGYQKAWCACVSRLLDDLDAVRASLPATLDKMGARAWYWLGRLDPFLAPAPEHASTH
jgi:colanic acid/amylovoran biosynthesis protein